MARLCSATIWLYAGSLGATSEKAEGLVVWLDKLLAPLGSVVAALTLAMAVMLLYGSYLNGEAGVARVSLAGSPAR